ncbi:hypothetical protein C7821_101383 [Streptomyces sp. VMFN-G11Ma]|nr:hypothetical protein C7821_101383 [Streptomyces sp. VMFN-G11Ma]
MTVPQLPFHQRIPASFASCGKAAVQPKRPFNGTSGAS